jgi:arylformamidase
MTALASPDSQGYAAHEQGQETMIYDISPLVSASSPVWPGDTPFSYRSVMEIEQGCSCNVATIQTTVHVGAHADSPYHFAQGASRIGGVSLHHYLGRARVVEKLGKEALRRDFFEALALDGVERLLIRTRAQQDTNPFEDGFSFLDPDAAAFLAEKKLALFGIDTPSVDAFDSKTLQAHHNLLRGSVAILEGLDLTHVPLGDYELIALPLKLKDLDASPVRAILRSLP